MKKNHLIQWGIGVLSVLTLVACGGDKKPAVVVEATKIEVPKLTGEVNVYNWIDYISEHFNRDFKQDTGVTVNYDTFDSSELLDSKIAIGGSGYDVVVPTSSGVSVQIAQGRFLKLDKNKIPNWDNLDPVLLAKLAASDPNNQYLVPWAWGFTGVGINEDKVKKALGNTPMPDNPYDLIFKPEYTSKLKSCGIFFLDSASDVMPVVLQYLGKPVNSSEPADYSAAIELLRKVRPDIRKIGDVDFVNGIADGNFCGFLVWSGTVNMAAKRANNPSIKNIVGHGGIVFIDAMAIPVDAKNIDNAYAWINYSLDPQRAAKLTNEQTYATPNKAALAYVNPEMANDKTIFLTPEVLSTMEVAPKPTSKEGTRLQNDTFRKFKSGRF